MKKNPVIAVLLSVVPGLGHIYAGDKRKGLVLISVIALIIGLFSLNKFVLKSPDSLTTKVVFIVVYLFTVIPCMTEAAQVANGVPPGKGRMLESKGYLIFMLFTTGMTALPLFWDSPNFSKKAKMFWSIVVTVAGVFFIWATIALGPQVDALMAQARQT